MRAVLAVAACALAACVATPTTGSEVPMREIVRGQNSQQRAPLYELVTTPERLNQLWRLTGTSTRPSIDFATHAVVAAFMGEQPTGGYAVIVERAVRDGDTLVVGLALYEPGPGCMATQALTRPFQLVAVPAGARDARFETRRVAEPCG